ncbi:hypothetical protein [Cryptosporangium sp. NPDC051539]|uniref:hypothetical protein n=1 Tax=Cryptosporangium sp. NPDC051539 TaxID=3363962 RepID=UPI0037B9E3B2
MNVTTPTRPPAAALGAIVLLALVPLNLVYSGVSDLVHGDLWGIAPLVFVVLWVLVLRGLWQGGHRAYTIAIVVAALQILAAFVAGVGVVVPGVDFAVTSDRLEHGVLSLTQLGLGVLVLVLLLGSRSRAFYARR